MKTPNGFFRALALLGVAFNVFSIFPVVQAADCFAPPAGLVAWWSAEDNAIDSVGANNGNLVNVGFTNGVVGRAFQFDPENFPYGTYSGVKLTDRPAYVLTNGLTVEGWLRERGPSYLLFFRGDGRPGLDPYSVSFNGNNEMYFHITDADGNGADVHTEINYGEWIHFAAVFDGDTGLLSLYTNAVLAAQTTTTVRPFANLDPSQSPGVGIGNLNDGGNNFPFWGDLDEISLYNRALTTNEIAGIYQAGTAGKCFELPLPPNITSNPQIVVAEQGGAASLFVTVDGVGPFTYQWMFNGKIIPGATSDTFTQTNLHASQAGNYTVKVSNAGGAVTNTPPDSIQVITHDLLAYGYGGSEKITGAGKERSYGFQGQLFFTPATARAVFVGWATINNKKQFWVNDVTDYQNISVVGSQGRTYTLLGKAGSELDGNGQPRLWFFLHKGQNTTLAIGAKKTYLFPASFAFANTQIYADPVSGSMTLREANSNYNFMPGKTQTANDGGLTTIDLMGSLIKSLGKQGYVSQ